MSDDPDNFSEMAKAAGHLDPEYTGEHGFLAGMSDQAKGLFERYLAEHRLLVKAIDGLRGAGYHNTADEIEAELEKLDD